MENILPYGKHHIDQDDIDAVTQVLKFQNLTQGEEVTKFENSIAEYVGAKHAVSVSSWTSGLHLSCLALGITKDDFVVTSPITFVATSNAVLYCQGKPIFCDIDPKTINLCPNKLEDLVKKHKVKAVIPVHFSGLSCDMEAIQELSVKYDFKILEDAAHALGAKHHDGSKIGSCKFSDLAGFSLHPVKSIAAGEGGIITTNNTDYYKKLIRLRSHGITKNTDPFLYHNQAFTADIKNPWYYEMHELGYNYRLTDIQCALANSQLNKLDSFISKRKEAVAYYDKKFESIEGIEPIQEKYRSISSHHLYAIRINYKRFETTRADLMLKLKETGIYSQVHYIPVLQHPFYNDHFQNINNFPNAQKYYEECLSIPLYYELTFEDQKKVIDKLKGFLIKPM